MRTTVKSLIIAPALAFAVACNDKPADPTLNNDLSLAAQANPNARLDSITAAERMNAATSPEANNLRAGTAPVASAPVRRTTTTSTATRRRSTASSSGTSSGTTTAPEPRVVTKKNTKRDAAIGAAAGAVIGAAASKDKVKGGLIGAAAGGILGGVIGNNVDIEKKRVP
jgi:cobalamin biosynthesis Mg chelatase CobN